ncbi:hypothetical protein SteCoe_11856 [Stentor coeruleus]|uniref:Uncharacterized protein n=1 Tax=Stentor coeruleus TaxID=5963 RepID=A0A1R2CC65_9CILI|nr:hypothetical protein SteCoe_11856 [Stentor coeruleus]
MEKSDKKNHLITIGKSRAQNNTVYKYRLPGCNFSRADRFSPNRFSITSEFANIPSTIGSGRKTSFGYGKRHVFYNAGGKDSPPCNLYHLPSCFNTPSSEITTPRLKTSSQNPRFHIKARESPNNFSIFSLNKTKYSTDASSYITSKDYNSPCLLKPTSYHNKKPMSLS